MTAHDSDVISEGANVDVFANGRPRGQLIR
jgi:hypothetical protein